MTRMAGWLIPLFFLFAQSGMITAAVEYEEGVEYERVVPAQPTGNKNKIEVLELFWYGCPHCYKLEPYMEQWKKKITADVEFVQSPAIFRPEWGILVQAFFTAKALGVNDKTHSAMFTAIHELKRPLHNENQIKALFMEHGVSEKDFNKTFNSFAVKSKLRRAMDMSKRYGIKGVPALIVNGKYRTSAHMAKGNANMLKVVDYLIKQERKAGK